MSTHASAALTHPVDPADPRQPTRRTVLASLAALGTTLAVADGAPRAENQAENHAHSARARGAICCSDR
jgi:hypothetical protein